MVQFDEDSQRTAGQRRGDTNVWHDRGEQDTQRCAGSGGSIIINIEILLLLFNSILLKVRINFTLYFLCLLKTIL